MDGRDRAADHRISSEPVLLDLAHFGHRWPDLLGGFLGGAKRVGDERAEERRLKEEAVVALRALDE